MKYRETHRRECNIIIAETEEEYAAARRLFSEYAASLSFDLCFQDFDRELQQISTMYGPPDGGVILLKNEAAGEYFGCAAIRNLTEGTAELKRMYLRPEYRKMGFGEHLLDQAIDLAVKLGYHKIRLDTMPEMIRAITLYERKGFIRISPYRYNPNPDALYFELVLNASVEVAVENLVSL